MTTATWRAAPIALLIPLLVAACGAAASPSPSASSTVGGSQPPAATSEPSSSEPAPSQPTVSSEPSGPSIDLGGAVAALEGIDSYRIKVDIVGTPSSSVEAIIVREPEEAQEFSITTGGTTQRIIVIGDQAWLDAGAGGFISVPVGTTSGLTNAFDPVLLLGSMSMAGATPGLETVGQEQKNGVQTTHYRVDPNSPVVDASSFPPGAEMEFWIADAGYLVSFVASGLSDTASEVHIDVTNINDPSNVVERPA